MEEALRDKLPMSEAEPVGERARERVASGPAPAASLLERIASPSDLKSLSRDELARLCGEIREFVIDVVSQKGGISARASASSS